MCSDRANEIEIHRENARKFVKEGNFGLTRTYFLRWVESVRQQNVSSKGALEKELIEAQREYSEFVKGDPADNPEFPWDSPS